MQLAGATFVVTGGASGLGAATARMIAAGGGNAVIADLKDAEGQALAQDLAGLARFVRTDVAAKDVGAAVDFIRQRRGVDKINLMGICQGGIFSTCYAALFPEKVARLILTVTPIDFHAGARDAPLHHGLIGLWAALLLPARPEQQPS